MVRITQVVPWLALALAACHQESTPQVDAGTAKPPSFAAVSAGATVKMGYAVTTPVTLLGGSARTFVVAKVDQPLADIEVGFVGPGSVDEPLDLAAGARLDLQLSVTAVDAARRSYDVPLALYTLAAADSPEDAWVKVSSMVITLGLKEPTFNVSAALVATDPATLAQTWRLTNKGDDVDGLDVRLEGVLATLASVRPEMLHVSLLKGETADFDVVPVLYPGMGPVKGTLRLEAGTQWATAAVTVAPPSGKQVFVGFGASIFGGSDSGEHCTNQSPLKKPIGKGPRTPKEGNGPDFWSKQGMANLYGQSTSEGMAAGRALSKVAGAKHLNVPMMALDQVFKGITRKLAADPPDANFKVVARPQLRTAPTFSADTAQGLTAEGAAALSVLVANGFLLADVGQAAAATLDKLGGAKAANDAEWMDKQEAVLRAYSQMLVGLARTHADLWAAYVAVAPEVVRNGPSADDVRAAQADLLANGFGAGELADFAAAGLSTAEVEELKASILAADPDAAAAQTWDERAALLWSGDEVTVADLARVFELSAMARASTRVPRAKLLVRFELPTPRCAIGPHTTVLRFNDAEVLRITDKVPEGIYAAELDPSKVLFFGPLPSGNSVGIDTLGLNTGNFVRALDATVLVELPLHGELVVAADQSEADGLVGALATTNHAKPDLVITTNDVPYLDRTLITGATLVTLPLKVLNVGAGPSVATKLGVYAEDPRLGDPGAPVQTEVDVPAIPAGQGVTVSVPVPGSLLLDEAQTRHYLWVKQAQDYRPDDNVVALTNEAGCGP